MNIKEQYGIIADYPLSACRFPDHSSFSIDYGQTLYDMAPLLIGQCQTEKFALHGELVINAIFDNNHQLF